MNNSKISEMVDRGYILDTDIKELETELDGIKKILKAEAKKRSVKVFEGKQGQAVIGPTSFSDVDPKKLKKTLISTKREKAFMDLVKVKLTEAKDFLGKTLYEKLVSTTTNPYGKISFKELKGKK